MYENVNFRHKTINFPEKVGKSIIIGLGNCIFDMTPKYYANKSKVKNV